jgi:peptidoglycan-associated lipoprotein
MKKMVWLFLIVLVLMTTTACAKKTVEHQTEMETPAPVASPAPEETATRAAISQSQPAPDTKGITAQQAQQEKMAQLQRFLRDYVYFDYDRAVLRADAVTTLQHKAQWLKDNPEINAFIIEGHCDERGIEAYNLALGQRRADAVKQFLVDLGLSAGMFQTHSFGEERPLDQGHDEEAWAKNRRAAFVINP